MSEIATLHGEFNFQFEHAAVSVERKGILNMLSMTVDGDLDTEDIECILNHIVDRELQTQYINLKGDTDEST